MEASCAAASEAVPDNVRPMVDLGPICCQLSFLVQMGLAERLIGVRESWEVWRWGDRSAMQRNGQQAGAQGEVSVE